jgi:DNA-binding transcriptional regulator YdaS (Cro superfamily)
LKCKTTKVLTRDNTLVLNVTMSKELLSRIIEFAGGQTSLAKTLKSMRPASKIRQGHINNWLNRHEGLVPSDWVIPICAATNWQVTPHELRPDIYPHPQDGLPDHLRAAA